MTARRLFFSCAAMALLLCGMFGVSPVMAQDSSEFFLRLNRLENQVRELGGTVERLEFENRRLQDQLKRFQEDVEFRFQESSGQGRQKRSDLPSGDHNMATGGQPPAQPGIASIIEEEGATAGAPLDLGSVGGVAPMQGGAASTPVEGTPRIPSVAATAPGDPQEGYALAESYLRRQQYEEAEMGFRQFLQSHPRDRLAADATFNLGESYFFRGRYREAAEQYLKLSTSYARSPRAPESMLKLGMSLEALGARDQACATFAETTRKFPDASQDVKQGLSRARARANCA